MNIPSSVFVRLSRCIEERDTLAARVAELEARTREAEESNANAQARLSAAEATIESRRVENEAVRRQLGRAENACDAMEKRVAELEGREKQRVEDEAWANDRTVLVEFQPVTSGWYASAPDGVVGINATATTIHGAIRALREKMESRPAEKATPCPYCLRVECECSDFDVAPDMGDK
jgi:DNA repair exonuclease SbcCD ATPase subunit